MKTDNENFFFSLSFYFFVFFFLVFFSFSCRLVMPALLVSHEPASLSDRNRDTRQRRRKSEEKKMRSRRLTQLLCFPPGSQLSVASRCLFRCRCLCLQLFFCLSASVTCAPCHLYTVLHTVFVTKSFLSPCLRQDYLFFSHSPACFRHCVFFFSLFLFVLVMWRGVVRLMPRLL